VDKTSAIQEGSRRANVTISESLIVVSHFAERTRACCWETSGQTVRLANDNPCEIPKLVENDIPVRRNTLKAQSDLRWSA
jgi:hypothetical protein